MRRSAIVLGAGLLLALLTGCPPTYPNCNSDEGCKEHNEFCVQGQCKECAVDANCKEGFTCQNNKCIPKPPECSKPGDCAVGKRCEGGKCVQGECSGDGECKDGKCVDARCVPNAPPPCSTDSECGTGKTCKGGECVARAEPECEYTPVRFAFNEHALTSEAQQSLAKLADCLKTKASRVTLEGHADERGTEEYNLQLSNKRAASVKKYLSDLGVGKLDTVGFGKNRPAIEGHDESAWATNRRVEFRF